MDSQHRHELHQNDLGKLTNQAVPFFEQHAWQILGGLVAVAAAIGIGAFFYTQNLATKTDSWTQLDKVLHQPNSSAGDYAAIADKHPGTSAAAWARLKEAEEYLKSGFEALYTNKELSQSEFKSAQEALLKLSRGEGGVPPDVKERALYDLARCTEALSDGSTDDALNAYKQLTREFPKTIFRTFAEERINALDSAGSKEFYAWFSQQKPKPADPHRGLGFRPPDGDGTEESTEEDAPDGEMKNEDAESSDATPSSTEEKDKKPADDSSDAEKPATEKPAPEKPGEQSKSDEESKPEGKPAPKNEPESEQPAASSDKPESK